MKQLDLMATSAARHLEARQRFLELCAQLDPATLSPRLLDDLQSEDVNRRNATVASLRAHLMRQARSEAGLPERSEWERYLDRHAPKNRYTASGRKRR
jgi:hypothetical protein